MTPGDILVLGILTAWIAYPRLATWWMRRRSPSMGRPFGGRKGKVAALLEEHGYRVWGGPIVPLIMRVDGRPHTYDVKPDLMAERGFRRYVVKIQSGDTSERLSSRQSWQRLIEYVFAFQPDGLLLVDAERNRIRRIEFRVGSVSGFLRWWSRPWLLSAAVGAALAYLCLRWAG